MEAGRLTVRDGSLHLPSGIDYRVLVLPDHRVLSLQALRKVHALVAAGTTVVGPRPKRAISLLGGAEGVAEFTRLAHEAWDPGRSNHVIEGFALPEVLRQLGVEADFTHNGGKEARLEWIHRVTHEGDLYFVANQAETHMTIDGSFRVAGRLPELWNPMSGSRREAVAFTQIDGRTIVPLQFAPHGSLFVLFRHSISARLQGRADSNFPTHGDPVELTGPWMVRFDPIWGGPESILFEALTDWSTHAAPGIKHYSGIAT